MPVADANPVEQLSIISRVDAPIQSLSWLRKSLLFAELSKLAYYPDSEIVDLVRGAGSPNVSSSNGMEPKRTSLVPTTIA